MRYLVLTDSVHATAAACDYLESRLDSDDAVHVVALPGEEDRDAEDAHNVATSRLLGRATVTTDTLEARTTDATTSATDEFDPDELLVPFPREGPGRGSSPDGSVADVAGATGVPTVVLPYGRD